MLAECGELGCLPAEAIVELRAAYLFLRDSEHAIQGYRDKQSQALPEEALHRAAMATVMGSEDWQAYLANLQWHQDIVAGHFRNLIAAPEDEADGGQDIAYWGEGLSAETLPILLRATSYSTVTQVPLLVSYRHWASSVVTTRFVCGS